MPGTLHVIATPLGNLDDLSARAVAVLRAVEVVACEDTRRTAKLLARYEIQPSMVSCHRFNEHARLEPILDRLLGGDDVALVSDGGTPGVSDPGRLLVRAALARGIDVSPIPGPSAPATLLSVSGLPADRYVFEGFLPPRAGERRRRLRELTTDPRTIVLFEAPHRIRATLTDIAELFGSRGVVLGRELTKVHETILHGSAAELLERLGDEPRGEITLALAPADGPPGILVDTQAERVRETWRAEIARSGGEQRDALRATARALGIKRAELYRFLVEIDEIDA